MCILGSLSIWSYTGYKEGVRTGVVSGQFEETGEDVPDWKATDV
jgi:hypothetical protein